MRRQQITSGLKLCSRAPASCWALLVSGPSQCCQSLSQNSLGRAEQRGGTLYILSLSSCIQTLSVPTLIVLPLVRPAVAILSMDRSQRIVLVLYCLLIVCCCVWVPWHVVVPGDPPVRIGYAWLWGDPSGEKVGSPDFPIIGLELFALTVLVGAGWAATRNGGDR